MDVMPIFWRPTVSGFTSMMWPGSNLRVLEGNQRPVPFDLQWARAIEREHEQTFGVEVRGDYPDYFPIVRDFLITHDGNLAFDRWRGNPEANHHPLLLSPTGAELPSQQWETYPRTIAVRNGQAYVSGFDEGGGEAYISRMPLAAVPTFIRENPIEFDGNTFRTFNRQ